MTKSTTEKLFNLYAGNWAEVKKHPRLHVEPDVSDTVFCPLCMNKYFTRDSLQREEITSEHIPPKKLGGKIRTLTCKFCNNTHGSKLDKELIDRMNFRDFISGRSLLSADAKVVINDEVDVTASFSFTKDGWHLAPQTQRNNPQNLETANTLFASQRVEQIKLTIEAYRQNAANAALLRIAYLWAFSIFGYGFLLNPVYRVIRYQIDNPEDQVLDSWGVFEYDFPDSLLGVHLVTSPSELRSFIAVFSLRTSSKTERKFGVLIPGPGKPDLEIYKNLKDYDGKLTNFSFQQLPQDIDFVTYPFASQEIWKSF